MATSQKQYFRIGCVVYVTAMISSAFAFSTEKLGEISQTAEVGSDAVLRCKPRDGQPVRWYYQRSLGAPGSEIYFNEKLVNGYNKSCEMDTSQVGEWNLIRKTVSVEHAGIYSCIEDNGQGDYYLTHLNVIDKAPAKIGERYLSATVGNRVVLHCKPTNGQPVRWYYQRSLGAIGSEIYNDGNLTNGYSRTCEMDTSLEGEWNLVIKAVTAKDGGIYSCIEDIGLGDYYIVHLNVLDPGVAVYDVSSSTTTGQANNLLTGNAGSESDINQLIVVVAVVSSLFTATLAAVIVLTVICIRQRHYLSKNVLAGFGGDESKGLLPKLTKGSTKSWKRVLKLKDALLPSTKANLSRWTSDNFVFEVIQDPECYGSCVDKLEEQIKLWKVDVIFGINVNDSRGEIFAKPLARRMGIKYEPICPAVLMPEREIVTQSFDTRFGKEIIIGIRKDSCRAGDRVVIIDSYVLTGGIKKAATELIEGKLQAKVVANVVLAAVNKELTERPLYSVFQPYFLQYHETDAGLFECLPAAIAPVQPVVEIEDV